MRNCGCGLTSFATILRYLGFDYTPKNVADFVRAEGAWHDGIDHRNYLFPEFRTKKDISYEYKEIGKSEVSSELSKGRPVFTGCLYFNRNGGFNSHYFVIKGVTEDKYYIADPYCSWAVQDFNPYYELTKEQFEHFGCGIYYVSFWK